MAWTADVGSLGGAVRCCGAGDSDNSFRDTREGGELTRIISTQGFQGIKLKYDLRVGPLGISWNGSGVNTGTLDHNLLQEQLTISYSINGGTTWSEVTPWPGKERSSGL